MKYSVLVVMLGFLMPLAARGGATVSFSISPTVRSGNDDVMGLVGSTVTFTGTISANSVYGEGGNGDSYAFFSSGSCEISGASVPSIDGVFAMTNTMGLGVFPNTEGFAAFFVGLDAETGSKVAVQDGLSLQDIVIMGGARSSSSPAVGDLVDPADVDGVITTHAMTFSGRIGDSVLAVYDVPGGVTNTWEVVKEPASLTLGATNQLYDGTARTVIVATDPAGVDVEITYDGSLIAPTNVGIYAVTGTVVEIMYEGSVSGTLVIGKGDQTISFENIGSQNLTDIVHPEAFASSGLSVEFAVASGPAYLTNGTSLAFTAPGTVVVAASQDGDANWNAAADVTRTFEVVGLPVVTITNPVSGTVVRDPVTSMTVSGTNNSWVAGMMSWTNSATGLDGTFPVSGSTFHVPDVLLSSGTNVITVSGSNIVDTVSSASITIIHSSLPIHYVSTSGTAVWPFTNWITAATTIQDAVDAAVDGDFVLVTNGIYSTGGAEVYSMSNRVALTKAVTLLSVNGPQATFIVGAADPVSTNGPAAVRCAYVTNGAVIAGFTLTNGHTQALAADLRESKRSGGGLWMDGGGIASNCTLSGNVAHRYGGGVLCSDGGTLNSCMFNDNVAAVGGGAYLRNGGMLNNCLLSSNSADSSGGGVYFYRAGLLNSCTLSGNSSGAYSGGASFWLGGILNNSIVWGNTAGLGGDNWKEFNSGDGSFTNVCTTPYPTNGVNCITNDPQFVDAAGGDYNLRSDSPCIDAGSTLAGITDDIEGTPRPLNGDGIGEALPDIGAYEYISPHYSTDGDAHSDYEEYIADTDPADSNNWFRITGFSAGNPATVSFDPASVNRQYSLLYSTNLVEGRWATVDGQTDISGSGGTNSLVHTNGSPSVFYRVEVELIE